MFGEHQTAGCRSAGRVERIAHRTLRRREAAAPGVRAVAASVPVRGVPRAFRLYSASLALPISAARIHLYEPVLTAYRREYHSLTKPSDRSGAAGYLCWPASSLMANADT